MIVHGLFIHTLSSTYWRQGTRIFLIIFFLNVVWKRRFRVCLLLLLHKQIYISTIKSRLSEVSNSSLTMVFNTNGKNSMSSNLILNSKQCFNSLNNIVSNLFIFALEFTIPQVSVSDLHKHKKWLQKVKMWNLVFSGIVR